MFYKINIKSAMFSRCFLIILFSFSAVNLSCNYRSFETNKPEANQTVENEIPPFERDLQTMRTANFDFIYVFRRKDGGAFDAEDRKYLRTYAPRETNRFISTDDSKAFIAGSSYKFTPENLETLGKRFNIEDYSAKKKETK